MAAFKFDWTIADAPKSAGVLAHGRMYHATQASNVPSILESGLRTGGASQGILTRLDSRYRHHTGRTTSTECGPSTCSWSR